MPRFSAALVTCEHGGNRIPKEYAALFKGEAKLLATHRGWDLGALAVARVLAKGLEAPLFFSDVSRLVVDLNRSAHHRNVLSRFTRDLGQAERERLYARYYTPYRDKVESWIRGKKRVLHLSIHSFTPELGGEVRNCEIGLLYDPRRPGEHAYSAALGKALKANAPGFRTRMNYPYRGTADGFMTHLRRVFPASAYVGVEIEMNQALARTAGGRRALLQALRPNLLLSLD